MKKSFLLIFVCSILFSCFSIAQPDKEKIDAAIKKEMLSEELESKSDSLFEAAIIAKARALEIENMEQQAHLQKLMVKQIEEERNRLKATIKKLILLSVFLSAIIFILSFFLIKCKNIKRT